jgi:TFIIF-interacting CTD phosphatase-like protein
MYQGQYVKDLSCLGRDLARVVIVDKCPMAYFFQPENAIQTPAWRGYNEPDNDELTRLSELLESLIEATDIRKELSTKKGTKVTSLASVKTSN